MLIALSSSVALVAVAVATAACGATDAERDDAAQAPSSSPPVAASRSIAAPSFPAGGKLVEGVTTEIRLGSLKKGNLAVSVERVRTADGVVVTARYIRNVNCHPDSINVCHTKYDVRRKLAESAFSIDVTLDTASLTTTVEGKSLRLTWSGFGEGERTVNEYGALMAESRPAAGVGSWGSVKHRDKKDDSTTSLLFRRAYATP